jgi:hypothetical protein
MKYLGVSRAELYSPGRVSGDAAVFRAVAAELERHGHEVTCMTEQELVSNGIPADIDGIFQMARSKEALDVLRRAGVPVTNTAQAVRNCARAAQTELLHGTGLIPESIICSTAGVPDDWQSYPCWIKRADSHAVEQDDVQYVEDVTKCAAAMRGLAARGLSECVLQAHAKGWLVKFYGVRGMGLTDCYAASPADGKFGLERYNDQPDCASVDVQTLKAVAERVSEILGVDIYGGDAVVGDDGAITVVDFNDWPSFRSCTVGAAQKIATLIMSKNR